MIVLTMKWTGDFLRSGPFVTDIEKSSFKCFEIGLKTVLPSQVHTQRITNKIWDHLPDSFGTSKDCLNFQVCNRVTLD